jgi:hypothetical protein
MPDTRPLLSRIVNLGVPRWVAIPCNAIGLAALVLLLRDPDGNLATVLRLLGIGCVALYGTALVLRLMKR